MLNDTQLQSLKTDATVTHAAVVYDGQTLLDRWNDNDTSILPYYNALANPTVLIWRPDITVDEAKEVVVWADFSALTPNGVARQNTYLALTQGGVINATKQTVRDAFVSIFGGGSASLTALTNLAQVSGTNLEALLAGATVQGAKVTQVYGYELTSSDVAAARLV